MIVTYDPVAMELTIDPANGFPPMVLRTPKLFVHLHSDGGHLGCEVEGDRIELLFEALDEAPSIPLFNAIAPGHWRLTFLHLDS